jgi:8-oxo-dGTP diphosphatase
VERARRIGVYGVCRDGDRVLLRQVDGVWELPGGDLGQGEHPVRAAERLVSGEVVRLRDALADVHRGPRWEVHRDRLIFDMRAGHGDWVPVENVADLPLASYTAAALGVPANGVDRAEPDPGPPDPGRGQRFGAYGRVTDPAGRVLLTLIAEGYPGAGRWHLPGGGTDFGEAPVAGLLRELAEETGQEARVVGLLGVSSAHNPTALGPEGYPVDWHAVRVHYEVVVDRPSSPVVTEELGGSTARAAWFDRAELTRLPLTGVAAAVLTGGS